MSAIVFQVPNADKAVILDPREELIYPFIVEGWTDLRLGAFISLTKLTDNDDTTGLAESLLTSGNLLDRVLMGFVGGSSSGGNSFFGLSNSAVTEGSTPSVIEAGDVATRWRYKGIAGKAFCVLDGTPGGTIVQDNSGTIFGPEMSEDAATNGGRASLFCLRMKRTSGSSLTVSNFYYVNTNRGGVNYADANVWSDNPSIGLIRSNLKSATWTSVLASQTFVSIPIGLVFYWPFANSRLRIHSLCIEKFA